MNTDNLTVTCNGTTFKYNMPEVWPECSAKAVCQPPLLMPGVMNTAQDTFREYIKEGDGIA